MKRMKQFFVVSFVIMVTLTSCKKDYTCECDIISTQESTNPAVPFKYESEFNTDLLIYKEKKKDAKELCAEYENDYKQGWEDLNTPGGAITYSTTGGCNLK